MVKQWKSTELYIGSVKPQQKVEMTFVSEGSLEDVILVRGSCSCTQCYVEGNTIKVTYKAQKIPIHLSEQGYYKATGNVKVLYSGGESDILTFYGKVEK